MEKLTIENRMYQMAVELINNRYPAGWGGAAVIHTDKDHFFTYTHLLKGACTTGFFFKPVMEIISIL